MTMISCETHGISRCKVVCNHVARDLNSNSQVRVSQFETNDMLIPSIQLCEECAVLWRSCSSENERDAFVASLTVTCIKCFEERCTY